MKRRLALSFARISDGELSKMTLGIIGHMSDNEHFPDCKAQLETISQLNDEYYKAIGEAHYGDIIKIAFRNSIRQKLMPALKQLGMYAETVAGGDETILLSSGFPLYKESAIEMLGSPTGFRISPGAQNGQIVVRVNRVAGAKSYLYEYTPDPVTDDSVWKIEAGTRCQATISNLPLGVKFWFRIAAVGPRKQVVYTEVLGRYIS